MSNPILNISRDGDLVKSQSLDGEADLGRGEGCVIRLDDRAISRQHAVFRTTPEGVQVQKKSDFASLTVNGVDCTSAIIREGDVIAIGPYRVKLQAALAAAAVTPNVATTERSEVPPPAQSVPIAVPLAPMEFGTGQESSLASAPGSREIEFSPDSAGPLLGDLSLEGEPDASPALTLESPNEADSGEGDGFLALESSADQAEAMNVEVQEFQASSAVTQNMIAAGEDEVTQVAKARTLQVGLVIPEGHANFTEFELDRDETTLGRDKDCEIVLSDKKSSRRHATILRAGIKFVLKDLNSANGTFVNGAKVTEQELYGGDRIRIGACEIEFRANSSEYAAREKNFMPVAVEPSSVTSEAPLSLSYESMPTSEISPLGTGGSAGMGGNGFGGLGQMSGSAGAMGSQPVVHNLGYSASPGGMPGGIPGGIPGMAGIPGFQSSQKQTLLQRYRNLPPKRKLLYTVLILGVIALLLFDDEDINTRKNKKPKPSASARPSPGASGLPAGVAFEALTPEQKKFVEIQHEQAFTHLKNKEYDKAIFEIRKIFPIITDYKDSREIERYSVEGKRKLEALEEERRKKAQEEKQKAEVAQLLSEVGDKMKKKQYDLAKELFSEILARDPENQQVGIWKREIQDFEDLQAQQVKMVEVRRQVNLHAWEEFKKALKVKAAGKCRSAIPLFAKIPAIEADDRRPAVKAKAMIADCRRSIKEARDPLLAEAKTLEDSGEFAKAWETYKKATVVDPDHPAGFDGMDRVRKVLHNRAKDTYTEAVLAESYSDFRMAKSKFKETMTIAPPDDIYYERSQRKLGRWLGSKQDDEGSPP